jgi:hypothetical protein
MKYGCFPVLRHFKEENSGKCALIFEGYVGHSKRHIDQFLDFSKKNNRPVIFSRLSKNGKRRMRSPSCLCVCLSVPSIDF